MGRSSYQEFTETEVADFMKYLIHSKKCGLGVNQDRTGSMTIKNNGKYVVQQLGQFTDDGKVAGYR